jgi:transketolase
MIGTGSEVQIAVAAREALEADGVPARVVSLRCWEWFAAQDRAYREQVLPPTVRARVSVEAGVPMGWREFVGDAGRIVGLDHVGASAAYTVLYEQFGLTAGPPARHARRPWPAPIPKRPAGRSPRPRPGRCQKRPRSPVRPAVHPPRVSRPAGKLPADLEAHVAVDEDH